MIRAPNGVELEEKVARMWRRLFFLECFLKFFKQLDGLLSTWKDLDDLKFDFYFGRPDAADVINNVVISFIQ